MILTFKGVRPQIGPDCYVAESAAVIGDVTIGADSSVWFGASVRGDYMPITIGSRTNVQDNATIHCDESHPTVIGNDVSIGHNAVVHGATLEDKVLVGMGAVVLDGAVIGAGSIVGAGAVVTKNTVVPPGSLVLGTPGKIVKSGVEAYAQSNLQNAKNYVDRKTVYLAEGEDT